GQVGATLAKHGVNIANFSLGRAEQGGAPRQALGVVRVDEPVPEIVIQELRQISAVEEARAINLPDSEK
ncbi:MAG: ACT domain-containing protein, partial [Terriglobales bacterium]